MKKNEKLDIPDKPGPEETYKTFKGGREDLEELEKPSSMPQELKEKIRKLKKEASKRFMVLLKEKNGFPLVIVYGMGEENELTLNVAHINSLNEIPEAWEKIVERIKIWAEGKNPQAKIYFEENTVDIENTKDTLTKIVDNPYTK